MAVCDMAFGVLQPRGACFRLADEIDADVIAGDEEIRVADGLEKLFENGWCLGLQADHEFNGFSSIVLQGSDKLVCTDIAVDELAVKWKKHDGNFHGSTPKRK